MAETPGHLRDWETLSAWLRSEWDEYREESGEIDPASYCGGVKEAYSIIGRMMRDCPPGAREVHLYEFLLETLGTVEKQNSDV